MNAMTKTNGKRPIFAAFIVAVLAVMGMASVTTVRAESSDTHAYATLMASAQDTAPLAARPYATAPRPVPRTEQIDARDAGDPAAAAADPQWVAGPRLASVAGSPQAVQPGMTQRGGDRLYGAGDGPLAQPPEGMRDGDDGLGRGTRSLLQLQVSGRAAAPALPVPGDEATAAYKRYIDSFAHPIPEYFENRVKSNSGS